MLEASASQAGMEWVTAVREQFAAERVLKEAAGRTPAAGTRVKDRGVERDW